LNRVCWRIRDRRTRSREDDVEEEDDVEGGRCRGRTMSREDDVEKDDVEEDVINGQEL
jgi:hypothetical protein